VTDLETQLRSRVAAGQKMLAPFLTAGYPDMAATSAILRGIDSLACGCIEIGIPFSDPVADGPTIQASFTAALNSGLTIEQVFAEFDKLADLRTPRIAMVSFTIAFRWGVPRFLQRARQAGFAGVLFPDLPLGAEPDVARLANGLGLANVMLVAPTTPPGRREQIAAASTGFVYYLSVAGITGERRELPADLPENVRALKAAGGGKPVFVGFGIGRAEQVAQVTAVADGAIVGSAIVRRITQAIEAGQGREQIAQSVRDYVAELCRGLPGDRHS
jgi:tryptophan synthase alpha chain